jgi:hypothetical protein
MTSEKVRSFLFRVLRPKDNALAGYLPSYAMNRIMEEST